MRRTARLLAALLLLANGPVGCHAARGGDPRPGEVDVDREFWYGGWHVRVASVQLGPDGRTVLVHGTFANLGARSRGFTAPVALEAGGRGYTTLAASPAPPTIAGGATQGGVLALSVDGPVDLRTARLVVGDAEHRQAVIPLGPDSGYEPQRPQPLVVTGVVNVGRQPHLAVAGAEARADNPEGYAQARAGRALLRLRFTAVNDGPGVFAIAYVFDHNLRVPSGDVVGDVVGCGRPQAHPKPYATSPGHVVCFDVPEPLAGGYIWFLAGAEAAGLRFVVG